MAEFEFSSHAREMMRERNISEEWVWRVIETGRSKREKDGNIHYTKQIKERDGRVLRVVVNPHLAPRRIVTLFFDRRLER